MINARPQSSLGGTSFRIVTTATPPKLAKTPEPTPLASQALTVVYPKTMARLTSSPPAPAAKRPSRYYGGTLWWEPQFRWRELFPLLLVVGWMVGLTIYLDRLERSALNEAQCSNRSCKESAVSKVIGYLFWIVGLLWIVATLVFGSERGRTQVGAYLLMGLIITMGYVVVRVIRRRWRSKP